MTDIVIAGALRTAIGKFGGSLARIPAPELGATVIKALLAQHGVAPDRVSEVILGQVLTAASGQNPARQALIKSGIPNTVPALTINAVCGSGLKAVMLAAQAVACGDADIVVAGGQENMSASPHALPGSRDGFRMGDAKLVDTMIVDGLWDVYNQYHMGTTAENVASKYGITREQQDKFAVASQNKAEAAQKAGKFEDEIVPVPIPQGRGEPLLVTDDEGVRPGTTVEALAKLKPAFRPDGTITAGSASQISDGATAVVVMSRAKAEELGAPILAEIGAHGSVAGPDPSLLSQPSNAIRKALGREGRTPDDVDLFEINEAFAVVAIQSMRDLGVGPAKVNVNGGAIAIGHPAGASGARIALHLILELGRRGGGIGAAGLCGGGGQGEALVFRVSA